MNEQELDEQIRALLAGLDERTPPAAPLCVTATKGLSRARGQRWRYAAITVAAAAAAAFVGGVGLWASNIPSQELGGDVASGDSEHRAPVTAAHQSADSERSFEPWTNDADPAVPGVSALLGGVLEVDEEHGCYLLAAAGDRYPIIWPSGTKAASESGVVLVDGMRILPGDRFSGGGGYVSSGPGVPEIPISCMSQSGEIAVFNSNARLTKP